jgi:hypothetical protein
MASSAKSNAPARNTERRSPFTVERARMIAPTHGCAEAISRTFALEPVDFEGIRSLTSDFLTKLAEALSPNVREQGMQIHLQRVVGAFVGSACKAAELYSDRVTIAREASTRLANEGRDEDREGGIGFDTRAERNRRFAADIGLQAYAFLACADGAVAAYAEATGSDWKPYVGDQYADQTTAHRAAQAELDAFNAQ